MQFFKFQIPLHLMINLNFPINQFWMLIEFEIKVYHSEPEDKALAQDFLSLF